MYDDAETREGAAPSPLRQMGRMLAFEDRRRRFTVRVAGLVLLNGRLLVEEGPEARFSFLPGGRVEIGEDSEAALAREMREEILLEGALCRLLFTVESFFDLDGRRFHELGFYYEVRPPAGHAFPPGDSFTRADAEAILRFRWLEASPEALAAANLMPAFLHARIAALPVTPEHLILREHD